MYTLQLQGFCLWLSLDALRYPSSSNQRSVDGMTAELIAIGDLRGSTVERPARRFVATRGTLQVHPIPGELHQGIVSTQSTANPGHPGEHSGDDASPSALGLVACVRARSRRCVVVGHHMLSPPIDTACLVAIRIADQFDVQEACRRSWVAVIAGFRLLVPRTEPFRVSRWCVQGVT